MELSLGWETRKKQLPEQRRKGKPGLLQLMRTGPVPAASCVLISHQMPNGSPEYSVFHCSPLFLIPPCYHPCPEKLLGQKQSKRYQTDLDRPQKNFENHCSR